MWGKEKRNHKIDVNLLLGVTLLVSCNNNSFSSILFQDLSVAVLDSFAIAMNISSVPTSCTFLHVTFEYKLFFTAAKFDVN